MLTREFISDSCNQTSQLARKVSQSLWGQSGVIALVGEIGTGKTTFVHYFLSCFFDNNPVSSPTFSIINEYKDEKGFEVFHLDLYRIDTRDEFISLDLPFYFDRPGIKIVEWADHPLFDNFVDFDMKISFSYRSSSSRLLVFEIYNSEWKGQITI